MKYLKASHATVLGLVLLAACADDGSSDDDGGSTTSDGSTGELPTSGSGSETTDEPTTTSSSAGDASSSTGGEETLQPRVSRFVEMTDGTRIAIDVWLPESALSGESVPTVMRMTRYWRAGQWALPMFDDSPAEAATYTAHGFAYVTVDARGSGASFGTRQGPWTAVEREDHGEVVDWVTEQAWSNGNVGAIGISYDGNTAAFLGASGRSAVKAVVPRFYDAAAFSSPAFPGGVYNSSFVQAWAQLNAALDASDVCALAPDEDCEAVQMVLGGAKWVDEDADGSLLAEAVAEHADNLDVYAAGQSVTYRDDAFGGETSLDDVALRHQFGELDAAVFSWASWMDAGTVDSALDVYAGSAGSHQVVIGAWNHGADEDADPFNAADTPVSPSEEEQHLDSIAFFDAHLSDDASPESVREIRYFTMNEGQWRTTDVWPPADVQPSTLYFGDGSLLADAPDALEQPYTVDYTATTGPSNRWWTQLDGDVAYPDRAEEDAKLMTYTGEPLAEDMRITGHPEVTVHLSTTHADGAVFVYLEDVAPDGRVTYLTEGNLRFVHRAVDPEHSMLHSYTSADAQDVVPGETMALTVRLRPTSVRLEAGHRIRVAIAGHDASNFDRYPAEGEPEWTVSLGEGAASHLVLPVASPES
jgi:putative CocE/NonD family hydrolase